MHETPGAMLCPAQGGYHRLVAEPQTLSLDEQLKEIGAQLAWVRDYL